MSAVFLMIPLALVVSSFAVAAFVWAVRRGQLDDLSSPPLRMLQEDQTPTAHRQDEPPVRGNQPSH